MGRPRFGPPFLVPSSLEEDRGDPEEDCSVNGFAIVAGSGEALPEI